MENLKLLIGNLKLRLFKRSDIVDKVLEFSGNTPDIVDKFSCKALSGFVANVFGILDNIVNFRFKILEFHSKRVICLVVSLIYILLSDNINKITKVLF